VYREKSLKTDAVQMHDRDASALREQLKAKDDRILQLEEVNLTVLLGGGGGGKVGAILFYFLFDCDNNSPPLAVPFGDRHCCELDRIEKYSAM
jgi:hypothetical protein